MTVQSHDCRARMFTEVSHQARLDSFKRHKVRDQLRKAGLTVALPPGVMPGI